MQNIYPPQAHLKTKRNRGGQQGNQNARKHGFYSGALTPSELCEFWNITNLNSLDPPIAVLRVKLQSFLRHDPGNRRVLKEATRLLTKWYSAKCNLDEEDTCYLKNFIWSIFKNHLDSFCQPDHPTHGKPMNLTKRIVPAESARFNETNRACFSPHSTKRIVRNLPAKSAS